MAIEANALSLLPPGVSLSVAQARTLFAIVQRCLPTAELWVFGSRATGRARPFSDLDLLLTAPASLSPQQRVALSDAFEASDLPFRVDLVLAAELSGGIAERVNEERVRLPLPAHPLPVHLPPA